MNEEKTIEIKEKDLRIVLDYVERWNKQDKEAEVAIASFNLWSVLKD